MRAKKTEKDIAAHAREIEKSARAGKPKTYRTEKLPELLRHLAADFIQRESNGTSLITVTRAEITPSKKRVIILYTVLPEDRQEEVAELLERRKRDFMEFIDTHARIGRMPELQFTLDKGEKNRQRMDELFNEAHIG